MKHSETISVLCRLSLLLAVVAIAVPGKKAKIILLTVLLVAGGIIALLLFKRDGKKTQPKAPPKHFTPEDINHLLESYGTDDAPVPKLAKLVKSKSNSELFNHGKVVFDDYTFFDITVCRSKNYQGKRYYRISAEENASEEEYFIKDDPEDRAVYLFSLNPDVRAFTDEVETNPIDDKFQPWKEFDSLEDYIGNSIPQEKS